LVRLFSAEEGDWSDGALREATEAVALFEKTGAHEELALAWRLVGLVHGVAGRYEQFRKAYAHTLEHARQAGNERLVARAGLAFSSGALTGPTPVPQAIRECEQVLEGNLADRQVEGTVLCTLAQLHAMNGNFGEARALYRRGRALLRELGQGMNAASTAIDLAQVELLAGDLQTAEREVRADYETLQKMGEKFYLSTVAALLARIVRDQGRDEEALALLQQAEQTTAEDDIGGQAQWRFVRAPIIARLGSKQDAERLAREAAELARRTEGPAFQADAMRELSEVLRILGRDEEAQAAIREAVTLYDAKGDKVSAARCRHSMEAAGLSAEEGSRLTLE
jgi:tetratricopeptide (TPR) repeat protein